ncbi:FeMo cofactor biosynthesis protein NifB [uncultured Alphaproteobacteria bacterium]|uniref:FeMo cofactor biosynthesis protein NifB n=1 Tax=uncultured Alphaproteobacteria bacterium TaxID=91750 RepID=A0A212K603_9PROT|nr:FeMo cofactor biosynthesis protein NifB [uncultured Alphaproteobacteria bacterium]
MPLGSLETTHCATGCGSADSPLPPALRAKIETHPCYSETAHLRFARMHVAVAPACNVQCNYCNRKFDCANESRPGVVSELLEPAQALRKVKAVAAKIPQLTVMGIAGPGDPLANPRRTFETLRAVGREMPGLKLCLSTNGLALARHVDEIAALGVDHVTITINAVDPHVAARIYAWVTWEGRRLTGAEGAAVLIREQLRGLDQLVARGILVKVNSVMIPGINDRHLPAVSRLIRRKGAFLHNVMPLISAPEHGTAFGLAGRRGPTDAELQALRDACAGDMTMMWHCKQCRADAVGMLGEDRNAEFTMDKVAAIEAAGATAPRPQRIAVATSGGGVIDVHFGHAAAFAIYEVSAAGAHRVETRPVAPYCTGECDDGDDLDRIVAALADCAAVACARIGRAPWERLEAAGIRPDGAHGWEAIEPALAAIFAELPAAPADRTRAAV